MNSVDIINQYFNEKEETKRLKEIENYVSTNKTINDSFNELKQIQQKMIQKREKNDFKAYKELKEEYDIKLNQFLDLPFVSEYIELYNYLNDELKTFKEILEDKLNQVINFGE